MATYCTCDPTFVVSVLQEVVVVREVVVDDAALQSGVPLLTLTLAVQDRSIVIWESNNETRFLVILKGKNNILARRLNTLLK